VAHANDSLIHAATLKRMYGAYVLIIVVTSWIYHRALVFMVGAEDGQLSQE